MLGIKRKSLGSLKIYDSNTTLIDYWGYREELM
jgi:hypothetical protein